MPHCPNCQQVSFTDKLCRRCANDLRGQPSSEPRCIQCGVTFEEAERDPNCLGSSINEEGHSFPSRFIPQALPKEQNQAEDRCLNCGQTRERAEQYHCKEAAHIFLRDLFKPHVPEPDLVDTSMDDRPAGLGLEGERFDLTCPDCGETNLRLKRSVHGYFYGCPSWPACPGTHGAHPDGRPKGFPGDKKTRLARIEAHKVFDQLYKGPKATMSTGVAYAWMALEMKLSTEEAHIARFNIEQCGQLTRLANEKLGPSAWSQLIAPDPFDDEAPVVAELEDAPAPVRRPVHETFTLSPPEDELIDRDESGADIMTIENFVAACRDGSISDDDGSGYYGSAQKESGVPVNCSDLSYCVAVLGRNPNRGWTHVWWYSK